MILKKVFVYLFLAAAVPTVCSQAQSITEMPLVLQHKDMNKVSKQSLIYKSIDDTSLRMDIYHPPGIGEGSRLPVVIFNNGVGSMTLPDWKGYTDWAKLVALRDLIAVHYQSRRQHAMEDSGDLIAYLRDNGKDLGIDSDRMAIWTSSANVRVGLPLAMDEERQYIRCAVVYYGSAQIDSMRQDLPLLIVRAGLDSFGTNRNMEEMAGRALNQDIQFELINYLQGQHAFDILDNTERSREIIRRTLDFLEFNLTRSSPGNDEFVFTAKNFYTMVAQDEIDRAIQLYKEAHEQNQNDPRFNRFMNRATAESSLNAIGYQLIAEDRQMPAVKVFELMVETFPESPNGYDSMADGYEAAGDEEMAIRYSKKALEKLRNVELRASQEQAIRESAENRLKRLEGDGKE